MLLTKRHQQSRFGNYDNPSHKEIFRNMWIRLFQLTHFYSIYTVPLHGIHMTENQKHYDDTVNMSADVLAIYLPSW